jgi:hypothetical protein
VSGCITEYPCVTRCPVDDKLISQFRRSWSESGMFETQVFAYMKTFRLLVPMHYTLNVTCGCAVGDIR